MNHLIQFFLSTDFQFPYKRAEETVFLSNPKALIISNHLLFSVVASWVANEKVSDKFQWEEKFFFYVAILFSAIFHSLAFQKYFISLMKALVNVKLCARSGENHLNNLLIL